MNDTWAKDNARAGCRGGCLKGKDFLVRELGRFAVCMQADERRLVRELSLVRVSENLRPGVPHLVCSVEIDVCTINIRTYDVYTKTPAGRSRA